MNKFYGETRGPSLWEGKAVALLLSCGYRPEKGCDLFETGMRRYCAHSRLRYLGSHAERHLGYDVPFMDDGKAGRSGPLPGRCWKNMTGSPARARAVFPGAQGFASLRQPKELTNRRGRGIIA